MALKRELKAENNQIFLDTHLNSFQSHIYERKYNIIQNPELMDQEDFIKIQPESPMKNNDDLANFYMTHFYDHDSLDASDLIKKEDYTQVVDSSMLLEKLEDALDFRTVPVEAILSYVQINYRVSDEIDWEEFERTIRKRKLMVKRAHAKTRTVKVEKQEYYVIADSVEGVDIKEQIQAEIKKKRNRMSAQISRDRKKIQIQELEASNKILKAETEKIMQENERLKRQLEEFNKSEEKKVEVSKGKNKFLSLLIMFGMFFLLTILRESASKSNPLKIPGKPAKADNEVFSAQEQSRMIENGKKTFKEIESQGLHLVGQNKVLKHIMFKLEQMKQASQDVQISKSLKEELEIIQRTVN